MLLPLDICGWLWIGWAFIWIVSANFTLKTKQRETIQRLQHTIPTTFCLIAIFHRGSVPELDWGRAHNSAILSWIGMGLTVVGHAFSIWARAHLGKYWSGTVALKQDHRLITSGPYAFVRHPIYTGLLLAVFGSALAAGTVEAIVSFCIVVPAYIIKWRREERLMRQEFGAAYEEYARNTKAIIPYLV